MKGFFLHCHCMINGNENVTVTTVTLTTTTVTFEVRIAFFACPTSDLPHLWTSSESLERHILGGVV